MGATMKDIASSLGISINAVSLALNNKPGVSDELRIKVLALARDTGYLAKRAKYMNTYTQTNLCVMMQNMYSNDMSFYGKVLYSTTEKSRKSGYDPIMNFFSDNEFIVPNCIQEYRVSGIIIIGKISDKNLSILEQYRIPMVIVDHASFQKTVNYIVVDNKKGGYMATNYMIKNGLTKIGFFGDLDYSLSIKERFFGYSEALNSISGLAPEEHDSYIKMYSITKNIEQAIIDNDLDAIVSMLKMKQNMPEGFVCSNDSAAIALTVALQSLNYKIPQDISITGFDNIDMTDKINPKITTINVDKSMMGIKAVNRIRELINSPSDSVIGTTLGVELVEKNSVKHTN